MVKYGWLLKLAFWMVSGLAVVLPLDIATQMLLLDTLDVVQPVWKSMGVTVTVPTML